MANNKRRQHAATRASTPRTGAKQPQPADPTMRASSAGAPTIVVEHRHPGASAAERTEQSLAGERAASRSRRLGLLAGIGALLVLGSALLLYFRPFAASQPGNQATVPQATATQATAAPAAQGPAAAVAVQPTAAAPAVQASAAPAVQTTAAPAASQAGSVAVSAGIACGAIAGLPVFADSVCVEQDTDEDDGLIKLENTYETSAATGDIQRFYESAFAQNGWILQEFTYDITVGLRQLTIAAEAEQGPSGVVTKIKLTEDGASTGVATTCNAIADLPVYRNATCVEFDLDTDEGVITTENTYRIAATPDEVRNFYANTLTQNSWTSQELSYDIAQGPRRIQVSAEAQPGLNGTITRIKVAEK